MSLRGQVVRFGVVGLAAAGLDWGILRGLEALSVEVLAARAVSLAAATVFTWGLNRWWAFRAETPPSWGEFARYVVAALSGLAINYLLFTGALLAGAPDWAAFVAGTAVAAVFNFLRYRTILKPLLR